MSNSTVPLQIIQAPMYITHSHNCSEIFFNKQNNSSTYAGLDTTSLSFLSY